MEAPGEQAAEQSGGGVVEALKGLHQGLTDVTGAATEDPSVPDEAKQAFSAALEAFTAGLAALEGGGEQPGPGGPVGMEQGASKGAVPMSMGRPA